MTNQKRAHYSGQILSHNNVRTFSVPIRSFVQNKDVVTRTLEITKIICHSTKSYYIFLQF